MRPIRRRRAKPTPPLKILSVYVGSQLLPTWSLLARRNMDFPSTPVYSTPPMQEGSMSIMAVVKRGFTSRIGRPITQPRLLYLFVLALAVSMSARLLGWYNAPCAASTSNDGAINLDVLGQYNDVNKRLVRHDDGVGLNVSVESERRYSFIDIAQSVMIADMFHQTVVEQSTNMLLERHLESKESCTKHAVNHHVLDSGGWCLTPGKNVEFRM